MENIRRNTYGHEIIVVSAMPIMMAALTRKAIRRAVMIPLTIPSHIYSNEMPIY
jgi:hypothetical protein